VDFGHVLDYLGSDPSTRALLLYIESIKDARKFLSAGRAAARNKPVLVIKAGRVPEGARAAAWHTGAIAGSDEVYDSVFRRAGMLRVHTLAELFEAVETLARPRPFEGDRLTILTNGGGPGVMATDTLIRGGGRLAEIDPETLQAIDALVPQAWSHSNPVDITEEASADQLRQVTRVLLQDPSPGSLLILYAPTALTSSEAAARAVLDVVRDSRRNVLTCWLGHETAEAVRRMLDAAGIPCYDTPEQAVQAFLHRAEYRRNQEILMQTPPSVPEDFSVAGPEAAAMVNAALASGRTVLTEPEAKGICAAYGIPVVETHAAATVDEAVASARRIGFPVALKMLCPEIQHKSEVGGVALDLGSPDAVRAAATNMLGRLRRQRPEATLLGFAVQPMVSRRDAVELFVAVTRDPTFGPVIVFGHGGTAAEVIGDRAAGLPPLNMTLADELISRTRVSRLLRGHGDHLPVDLDAVRLTLVKISQLVIDLPAVESLRVNPLWVDVQGVLALDARIELGSVAAPTEQRLAIRPYPRELEEPATLRSGRRVWLRPIRPEDEAAHKVFFSHHTPEDVYFRFFRSISMLPHSELARLTQIDYDREMAIIATTVEAGGAPETLGVVRVATDPDNLRAELGISVRPDVKGEGLGRRLLTKIVEYCRERGTSELVALTLPENTAMLELGRRLGFVAHYEADDEFVELKLVLQSPPQTEGEGARPGRHDRGSS
jgi:acetyltransferase